MRRPIALRALVFVLLPLLVPACGVPGDGGEAGSADGPVEWSLASEPMMEIGVVEGDEAYQLYDVRDAVVLPDGAVAVANQGSRELRVYEPDGTHRLSSGGQGEGPGEWRMLMDLEALGGDTVLVVDPRLGRYGFVDARTGEFLGAADSARAASFASPRFFHAGLVVEGVPPGDRSALVPVLDRLGASDPEAPALVRVEEDGEVFVHPAGSPGPRTLRVFDLEGRHRASLTLPPGFQPFSIGRDRVVGLLRDEMGVNFVQVRELAGREPLDLPTLAEAAAAAGDRSLPDRSAPSGSIPEVSSLVKNMASHQELHYAGYLTYTDDVSRLGSEERPFEVPAGVDVQIMEAGPAGWMARFLDEASGGGCMIMYGAFARVEGLQPGSVTCWGPA